MVAAENEEDAQRHLATLDRQRVALEAQRDSLRTLRDDLTAGWPPDKSEAATAFLDKVNDMIDAMTQTAVGAGEVRANLSHIVGAIGQARDELAPLVAQYDKATATADPRIGRQTQKLLDERARGILVALDATVLSASPRLDVPLPQYGRFTGPGRLTPASTNVGGGVETTTTTGSGSGVASGTGGAAHAGTRLALAGFEPPQFNPPAPSVDMSDGDGFVLAADPPPLDPGAGRLEHSMQPFPAGQSGHGLQDGPPLFGPSVISSADPIGVRASAAPGTARPGQATSLAEGRGAIGGVPIGGTPVSASRLGSGTGPRRPAIASPASPDPAHERSITSTGGYRDRSFEDYAARRRGPQEDRDELWSVDEGVAPLLDAPTVVRIHDPGAGVLGIDR
jgi:hypothetical protein